MGFFSGLEPNTRIGPRHPRLGRAGFRFVRWLAKPTMRAAGFHQLDSRLGKERLALARQKLARGETLYLAGLGAPGTHNSGVALVEVAQGCGPRLLFNNEEERFSGTKHTAEYPHKSLEAMAASLRAMGSDVTDVFAWLTSWDYPTLAGTLVRASQSADVALIQLPQGTYAATPIGASKSLQIGDPVFAIGTPLQERFSRTLTKGVVSALRPRDGRTVIQSDVIVHAGSSGGALLDEQGRLVGLVISGVALGGQIGVGLNEFLGIDDAWRALQVEPQINTVEASSLIRR